VTFRVIHNGHLQKYSKNRPLPPCPLLSAMGHTCSPLLRASANVTKCAVTVTHGHPVIMSVSDCCWHWQDTVLAAGCQRVLSISLLPVPWTPQSACCKLQFIQLVTLSLFTCTTHSIAWYMLRQRGWLGGCLSVTHRYCIKMAKPILKNFFDHLAAPSF